MHINVRIAVDVYIRIAVHICVTVDVGIAIHVGVAVGITVRTVCRALCRSVGRATLNLSAAATASGSSAATSGPATTVSGGLYDRKTCCQQHGGDDQPCHDFARFQLKHIRSLLPVTLLLKPAEWKVSGTQSFSCPLWEQIRSSPQASPEPGSSP